jgi:peptide/nickel transport system permease protein
MSMPQIATEIGTTPVTMVSGGRYRGRGAGLLAFWQLLRRNPKALVGFFILLFFALVAIVGPFFAPYDPNQIMAGLPSESPSPHHLLGTTRLGQDIFSELLAGTRASLLLAVTAGLLTTVIATLVGMSAGYLGGWIDDGLSLLANVFLIIPSLPLLIVISTYAVAFHLTGPWVMAVAITATGWPWGARALRSQMLSMRNKDFVLAARVAGESWIRVIWAEILPNMLSIVVANFIFSCLAAVVAEAGLEFIGLGDISRATWGTILYWAQSDAALLQHQWWWFVPPGVCIGIFSTGLVLMNYAIDEITNPRLRVQREHSGSGPVPQATTNIEPDDIHQVLDHAPSA